MSASDRPSRRAAEPPTNDQLNTPGSANSGEDVRPVSGADGSRQPAAPPSVRLGRRRQRQLRAQLSDRDWRLLSSLEGLHYATSRQLERLHYRADLTPLSAARTVNRDLHRLHDWKVVEHLERRIGGLRAGSAAAVWTLTGPGQQLLGEGNRRRSHEPSLLHLEHVLAVSELVVQVAEQQQVGAIDTMDVQTEPTCWRVLPAGHGGRLTCKPDLRLTLTVGDEERHWFVEVDRSTEHRPVLARKCQVYLQLWRSGQEQAEHEVFPRVLWLVPDPARQAVLEDVIEHLRPTAPPGMFATSTPAGVLATLTGLTNK